VFLTFEVSGLSAFICIRYERHTFVGIYYIPYAVFHMPNSVAYPALCVCVCVVTGARLVIIMRYMSCLPPLQCEVWLFPFLRQQKMLGVLDRTFHRRIKSKKETLYFKKPGSKLLNSFHRPVITHIHFCVDDHLGLLVQPLKHWPYLHSNILSQVI
jgi:hypothetical protein